MSGWNGKVDRLNSLIELVRATSSVGKAAKTKQPPPAGQSGPGVAHKAHDMGELRRRITAQLHEVETQAPLTGGQVSRAVVREILLWEFGPQLEQHSEFGAMLGTIEKAFDANPSLKAKMAGLVEELKQEAG